MVVTVGTGVGGGLHGRFCWESQRDTKARDARSPSSLPSPKRDRGALPRTARLGAAARAREPSAAPAVNGWAF